MRPSTTTISPETKKRLARVIRAELGAREHAREERGELEADLGAFHRQAWRFIDPAPYKHNWSIDAAADHLMAVTRGHIRRLIITQPPRTMKSLMVSVSWPAFTWAQGAYGPLSGPHVKFVGTAYDPDLSTRDAIKTKRLIRTAWYRSRWSDRFDILADKDQNAMYENSAGGFRFSTSVQGMFTGEGADIIIIDDPINVLKALWSSAREKVNGWYDETVTSRLNDPMTGAKVIIMQRTHEDDLVGHILEKVEKSEAAEDYVVLNLPMEFDPALDTRTWIPGFSEEAGDPPFFEDPRTMPGELLWPERFPESVIEGFKSALGPFGFAAQYQQRPAPRGGGIIERDWWQLWPPPDWPLSNGVVEYPATSIRIGSLDTAYGEKDTDSWNAMTTWGVFPDERDRPKTVLMEAWRARLPLRGVFPEDAVTDDERRPHWGLAEKVHDTIRRRAIDILLIENKTRAVDLAHELRRLLQPGECRVILLPVAGDKVARLHAVQALFADQMVFAPDKAWAETVMGEVASFPRSKFADYVDTVSQALSWMRNQGILQLGTEADSDNLRANLFRSKKESPYDV